MAINATETALNSTGSAQKEFATALDSIEKRLEGIAGSFTELVTNGGLTDFIKLILTATQSILDFANSDLGQIIIQVGLLTSAIVLLSKGYSSAKLAVLDYIKYQILLYAQSKNQTIANYAQAQSYLGLSGSIKAVTIAWATSPMGMATIAIAGIVLITTVIDSLNVSLEENQEKLEDTQKAYSNANSSYESAETKLKAIRDRIVEINSLDNISPIEQLELDRLALEEAGLENILAIERQRRKEAYDENLKQAEKTINDTVANPYRQEVSGSATYAGETYYAYSDVQTDRMEVIKDASLAMEEQIEIIKNLNGFEEQHGALTVGQTEIQKKAIEKYNELASSVSGYATELQSEIVGLDENEQIVQDVTDALSIYGKALRDGENATEDNSDVTKDNTDALAYSAEELAKQAELVESSAEAYDDVSSNVVNMKDLFEDLNSIVSDYNSNNGWTLDSLEKLISMGSEYVSLLQFENGTMSINEQGAIALANAKISTAQAGAVLEAQTRLEQIAMEQANGATSATGATEDIVASQTNNLTNELAKLSTQAVITAQNMANLLGTEAMGAMGSEADSIRSNLLTTLNAYQSIRGSIGKYTTAVGSSSGSGGGGGSGATGATDEFTEALKREKEALEEVQEALEKQIDEYEIVIDYVKDRLKDEQEAVEDEKDTVLGAIQDKIDALEDEQDIWETNIDLRIEALEKEKDAFNEIKDAEIESLEERIDAENDYWENQIANVQNSNSVIQDNIDLQNLQEALARAKSSKVMVLKNGQFVYTENSAEVSQAEEDLANYERELAVEQHLEELEKLKENALASLQEQLDTLNDYVDDTNDNYDKQVSDLEELKDKQKLEYEQQLADLEKYYDDVELEYDNNIAKFDEYTTQFEDMLSATADAQAEILYQQLVGEQDNWDDRLTALGKFVSEYEAKQKELEKVKTNIDTISSQISASSSSSSSGGGSYSSGGSSGNNVSPKYDTTSTNGNMTSPYYYWFYDPYNSREKTQLGQGFSTSSSAVSQQSSIMASAKSYGTGALYFYKGDGKSTYLGKYAKGTPSINEDEIAFVGDSPNTETVIGAKYNKSMGIPMNLSKGTGIVPAKESSTLASLMTNLARGNSYQQVSNNNGTTQNISIDKMIIDGVQNANDFAQELSLKFRNIAMQKAY